MPIETLKLEDKNYYRARCKYSKSEKSKKTITRNEENLLIRGAVHDISGALSAMIGFSHILERTLKDEKEKLECVRAILEGGEHCRNYLNMLRFSADCRIALVDVNLLVDNSAEFYSRALREYRIDIEKSFSSTGFVKAKSSDLERILQNLVNNARDAMIDASSSVRKITIKTEDYCASFPNDEGFLETGNYILLSVSDTGPGIPENNLKKIFDQWFTTKQQGTGLGLSIVRELCEDYGGNVEVETSENKGALFKVYLPRCDE